MSDILSQHPWLSQQSKETLLTISDKTNEFELSEQTVVDWFSNFSDEKEYELALKIFFLIDFRTSKKSIDTIKIYETQIRQSMHKLNCKNIVLISSDENTDSSNRFIYDIAKAWQVTEVNVFRKSQLTDNIINDKQNFFVFFNDTHGTGNQFVGEFKNIIASIGAENCAIISITMTDKALKRFKEEFQNIALIQPSFQSTRNIDKHRDEQSLNSSDINLLKELGGQVYSKGVLGYKDTALLVAYSHQCPNNTLPIIWANGINNDIDGKAYPWKPLFEYKKVKETNKKKEPTEITQEKISTPKITILEDNLLTTKPPVNPDFVGRTDELGKIKENLEANNLIYIVNGIGGVGKSELSYEYFHKFSDHYKKTAFIELSSDVTLEELFIIKFKDKFQLDNFEAIIRRLQEFPKKNLFLIDNLEKIEDFEKLKALNSNFDLLITTRRKDIDINHQLELNTLSPQDAKKLFLQIYKIDENIEDILVYLDNHPLFINLMAKSLQRQYISLEELRDNIKNNTIAKINSKDEKTFEEHLRNTFNKQFENEKNEELKILLQKLAIFPSIEINLEIFTKLLDVKKVELQMLVDRGWLSQKEDEYKLHQIIKTFILAEHPLEYSQFFPIFKTLAEYINPEDSTLIASSLNSYIPVIESFLNLFEEKEDEYIAGIYDSLTYLYFSLAQYHKALEVQNKSCDLKNKLFGENSEFSAKSYNLLGIIHRTIGEFDKALPLYEKSLTIREAILGKNHQDTATSYNNLGVFYKITREFDKALPLYEKSLAIREAILGENHQDTAGSYNNLAGLYESTREFDKALPLYKKSLKIHEDLLGKNHPNTATCYHNLAGLCESTRDFDKALPLYQRSIKICEQFLGENHPSTATSYNNLASLYQSTRKFDKALTLYKKSLIIHEEVLGVNHPDTATCYANLGFFFNNVKDCIQANYYLSRAKEMIEKFDYKKDLLLNLNNALKQIEKNQKLEAKATRKGRFCKEYIAGK